MRRPAALWFILITVTLNMLGLGLVFPVTPKLVTELSGGDISNGSTVFGLFTASYALMQFLFSPLLGSLSDSFGRRPVILLSLFGAGLDYILLSFAPTIEWLFLGRVIGGMTAANISAANAYIADVSPPEQRAHNFGLIQACFGIGFILGPAVGGVLGTYGLRTPFMAAAVLTLLNALYGFFVLPESHRAERRREFSMSRSNPFGTVMALSRFPAVLGFAATRVLGLLANNSLVATWVLFTLYRFDWSEAQVGLSLAVVGVAQIVVSGGLTGLVVRRLGERRTVVGGLLLTAACYPLYGLAPEGWMLYPIIVVHSMGGVYNPALNALISRSVPPDEQGAVQGAIASLTGLATIVGPLIGTMLFAYFTSDGARFALPGVAFYASSLMAGVALAVAVRSLARSRLPQPEVAILT